MSQEKVDRYKKDKANRKKALAKQKQQKMVKTVGAILGSALLIVAIVLSVKQLNGDFAPEPETETSSYSEEYLEQIRQLFGESSTEEATTGADSETK